MRTAYTRYLRELRNAPSGSAAKKKKWYLADAMSFLATYAGPQRKMISNLSAPNTSIHSTSNDVVDNEEIQDNLENEENNEFPLNEFEPESQTGSIEQQVVIATAKASIERKKNKKTSAAEVVAGPMVEYLKTVTAQAQNQGPEPDEPTLTFFKSLVPDVNKLDARTQRNFKVKVMELLNSFLDQQEESQSTILNNRNSSRRLSVCSFGPPSSDYSDHSAMYSASCNTRTVSTGPPSSEQQFLQEDHPQQYEQSQQNESVVRYATSSHTGHFFPL